MSIPTKAIWFMGAMSGGVFPACIVEVDGHHGRIAYEACSPGDSCPVGTACIAAAYSLSGQAGYFCSTACSSTAQCPASIFTLPLLPVCVADIQSSVGLCYDSCLNTIDCGGGTACAAVPGTSVRVCVPAI